MSLASVSDLDEQPAREITELLSKIHFGGLTTQPWRARRRNVVSFRPLIDHDILARAFDAQDVAVQLDHIHTPRQLMKAVDRLRA